MPLTRVDVGTSGEVTHPAALRAAAGEFIATLIFVFAAQGSAAAFGKLTPAGLVATALAHAFALSAAFCGTAGVSGGHVNPAVTFGLFVGGRISLPRGVLYWIAQVLGSTAGFLLLRVSTGEAVVPFGVAPGVAPARSAVMEGVMGFALVYVVYATAVDLERGRVAEVAPMAIGCVVGANVLAGGPFDGAVMNPAVAIGAAVVGWGWAEHWVYWVGPLVGGAIAGLLYEYFFVVPKTKTGPPTDY